MSNGDRERIIRRILVALDASPHSLAALRAAAELAAELDAELMGLYVEDINLLRLSELPFAREVTVYAAAPRQLDRTQVQRQLRAQATQARRALAAIAGNSNVRWEFRVAQGLIGAEVLSAAQEFDLVLLGKSGWSRRRLGSTARLVVSRAPRLTMIIQQGVQISMPIGILYDGSPESKTALLLARDLLRYREGFIVALIRADTPEKARLYQSEISEWARQSGVHVHYRWLLESDKERLYQLVGAENCGLLVLPGGGDFLQAEDMAKVLENAHCPVLLVRS
jgi:nucleotide-binding universal stress UspA family protein